MKAVTEAGRFGEPMDGLIGSMRSAVPATRIAGPSVGSAQAAVTRVDAAPWCGSTGRSSPPGKQVIFVSNMDGSPWGGSEELWAGAALRLADEGFGVGASVHAWSPPHERIIDLSKAGIEVRARPDRYPVWRRAWAKVAGRNARPADVEVARFLTARRPALVVVSDPAATPPLAVLEECVARNLPFVTISQSNSEHFWPDDAHAAGYRRLMPAARRCFFVSKANQRLFESQIGCPLRNAEVIWNPFNVPFDAAVRWPATPARQELRLACVARLHPPSKGHDLLLEALAGPAWRERSWRLTLYGEGPMRNGIERMIERLGLGDRIRLAGHVSTVDEIWAENHALVMPSRYEGMPLALIEAMLCGRAALATDVAGHAEVITDEVTGFLADAPTAASLARGLERLWTRRTDLESIGARAAASIRARCPADPARVLADKIKSLMQA